jgi:hypothetical protein
MSSLPEMPKLKHPEQYDMSASKGSTFLDIGSGFGKPVFHAALQTNCESYGVEIVPARVSFCEDQKYNFMDYYASKRQKKDESKPVLKKSSLVETNKLK